MVDQCVNTPGAALFDWCPIPWWVWTLLIVLGLALAAFFALYLIPLIRVTRNNPPRAYLEVIRSGRSEARKSTYSAGMAKRKSEVTIGSSKRTAIQVPGLKAFEFVVIREGGDRIRVYKTDDKGKAVRAGGRTVSTEQGEEFSTSNNDIVLKVSLPPQQKGTSRPGRPEKPKRSVRTRPARRR